MQGVVILIVHFIRRHDNLLKEPSNNKSIYEVSLDLQGMVGYNDKIKAFCRSSKVI